jgi:hypothetical protein
VPLHHARPAANREATAGLLGDRSHEHGAGHGERADDPLPVLAIYEESQVFPLRRRKPDAENTRLTFNSGTENQFDAAVLLLRIHPNNCRESTRTGFPFWHDGLQVDGVQGLRMYAPERRFLQQLHHHALLFSTGHTKAHAGRGVYNRAPEHPARQHLHRAMIGHHGPRHFR